MNRAVDFHSGPFMTADATWPSQSSPAVIENPLCSLNAASLPPGMMMAKFGRCPDRATLTKAVLGTLFVLCLVSRHSAKEGQMSQTYPSSNGVLLAGGLGLPKIRHDRRAECSRSRMVGRCRTGVWRNAPPLGSPSEKSGTQLGTFLMPPPGGCHGVILLESHPHPGPLVTPGVGPGFPPRNPSSEAITAYRCPPQDGLSAMVKVRSLMANRFASAARFGTCADVYPPRHTYPLLAWQPGTFCQPSIFPPSMAACWEATVCDTFGTMSGITAGVTTVPSDRVTVDGMPPSGHRPGCSSHQNPSKLSNVWFSRYSTTMCRIGDASALAGDDMGCTDSPAA